MNLLRIFYTILLINGLMSIVEWFTKVVKGNATGTGWITLPIELHKKVSLKTWYNIKFTTNQNESFDFLLKLLRLKSVWGFYIPKASCTEHHLIGQLVSITLQPSEYFPAKVSADKRIRLPNSVVETLNLKEKELYEVELNIHDKIFHEVVLIAKIDRSSRNTTNELYFTIRMQDIPTNTKVKVKINKKLDQLKSDKYMAKKDKIYLPNLFPEGVVGKLSNDEIIIFLGRHKPIITPIFVKVLDIIHYFGCYYADGTKSGWGWSISASTPEQTIYYINKYKSIVLQPKLVFQLTYTLLSNVKESTQCIKENLIKIWQKEAGIEISPKNIYILPSSDRRVSGESEPSKHNPIGSLRIRDNRGIVLVIHLKILSIIKKILFKTRNKTLPWQFLFGILEGDGSVGGGKNRCRVLITCEKFDKLIPILLSKVDINQITKTYRKGQNVVNISFGLIPILHNFSRLQKSLFKYYPKRRKTFIKRLLMLPSIRYLLREKETLSHFALNPLKKNNLLNNENLIFRIKELKKELIG